MLMLAVVGASADEEMQHAMQTALGADPRGERTITVYTKMDEGKDYAW